MTQAKQSRIHKAYFRNGENHRGGADVSFADIVKIFGFRAIEIGKWVTREEQQIAANLFFDALCDLMDILKVPESVISLNGTLALAFGVGGRKHVSAHYDGRKRQLALAKNAGGGALAHEWFHAFDHFITPKFVQSNISSGFASSMWLENRNINPHPLNNRLEACFEAIFLDAANAENMSTLMLKSVATDKAVGVFYYSRPQEVAARAFEAFVQDHSIKNQFLVQGTKQSADAKSGVYPTGAQRVLITQRLARYFCLLGSALNKEAQ
jgi:hypothetical protein